MNPGAVGPLRTDPNPFRQKVLALKIEMCTKRIRNPPTSCYNPCAYETVQFRATNLDRSQMKSKQVTKDEGLQRRCSRNIIRSAVPNAMRTSFCVTAGPNAASSDGDALRSPSGLFTARRRVKRRRSQEEAAARAPSGREERSHSPCRPSRRSSRRSSRRASRRSSRRSSRRGHPRPLRSLEE